MYTFQSCLKKKQKVQFLSCFDIKFETVKIEFPKNQTVNFQGKKSLLAQKKLSLKIQSSTKFLRPKKKIFFILF